MSIQTLHQLLLSSSELWNHCFRRGLSFSGYQRLVRLIWNCGGVEKLICALGPNRRVKSQYKAFTSSLKQLFTRPKLPTSLLEGVHSCSTGSSICRSIWDEKLSFSSAATSLFTQEVLPRSQRQWQDGKSTMLASHPIKTTRPTAQLSQQSIGGVMLVSKNPPSQTQHPRWARDRRV